MPFAWTPPSPPPLAPVQSSVQKPGIGDFGDELQVTGKVQEIDVVRQIAVYSEGVAAKFGPTMVFADRLEIHHADGDKYAVARGNVRVEDPEGTLKAQSVVLWYGPTKGPDGQIAAADHVEIDIGGVNAKAERAVLRPERWEFWNVEATPCDRPLPFFSLKSKKVVVVPGRSGTAYRPEIKVLGQRLGQIPTRQFSLDRRSPGLQFPSINYKAGSGLGISWESGKLLDDQSLILAGFGSFPGDYPSYQASYARTFLPADVSNAKISARPDLTERFNWSYFDNIRVNTPSSSRSFAYKPRNSITAQTIWNTSSSARLEREQFSKALEFTYEKGGPVGPFGVFWQARAHSIRRGSEPFVERATAIATVQAPTLNLARGLTTDVRADFYGIAGERNVFGWARAQAGLVYHPIPQLTLGGAFITAGESGTPDFSADRLVSRHAVHLRADVNLGPTKLSYLAKWDFDRGAWYDKEYSISQVIGCLEPFLIRREFPSDYALGVRFRMDDFLGILQRRKQIRTKPVAQVISGPAATHN